MNVNGAVQFRQPEGNGASGKMQGSKYRLLCVDSNRYTPV